MNRATRAFFTGCSGTSGWIIGPCSLSFQGAARGAGGEVYGSVRRLASVEQRGQRYNRQPLPRLPPLGRECACNRGNWRQNIDAPKEFHRRGSRMRSAMRGLWAFVIAGSIAAPAHAVIFYDTGDANQNTTAPTGSLANSGWQYEGQFDGFLGT